MRCCKIYTYCPSNRLWRETRVLAATCDPTYERPRNRRPLRLMCVLAPLRLGGAGKSYPINAIIHICTAFIRNTAPNVYCSGAFLHQLRRLTLLPGQRTVHFEGAEFEQQDHIHLTMEYPIRISGVPLKKVRAKNKDLRSSAVAYAYVLGKAA